MEVDPKEWIYCSVCNRVFQWEERRTNEFGWIACRYWGCTGLLRNFHYFEKLRAATNVNLVSRRLRPEEEPQLGTRYFPELLSFGTRLLPPQEDR